MLIKENKPFCYNFFKHKFYTISQILCIFLFFSNITYAASNKEFTNINVPSAIVMDVDSR